MALPDNPTQLDMQAEIRKIDEVSARLLTAEQLLEIIGTVHVETSTNDTMRTVTIPGITSWSQLINVPLTILSNAMAGNSPMYFNVNNLGTKSMLIPDLGGGSTNSAPYALLNGMPYVVVYTGSTYVTLLHKNYTSATTASYGLTILDDSITSGLKSTAATSSAVKAVNDTVIELKEKVDNMGESGGSSTPIIDNLTSTSTTSALSANQGRVLNETKEPSITASTASTYWNGLKQFTDFAASVRTAVLTSLSTSIATVITATDTVLSAIGKLQAQITALTNNVLQKDNTASYTPTANYHPATKKYVDDKVAAGGGGGTGGGDGVPVINNLVPVLTWVGNAETRNDVWIDLDILPDKNIAQIHLRFYVNGEDYIFMLLRVSSETGYFYAQEATWTQYGNSIEATFDMSGYSQANLYVTSFGDRGPYLRSVSVVYGEEMDWE